MLKQKDKLEKMAKGQLNLLECRAVAESILADDMFGAFESRPVQAGVKPAYDVADIKIKAKLMENKYWLNFLTLDTTNIIHKSCLKDRITELEKIQNENRKSV